MTLSAFVFGVGKLKVRWQLELCVRVDHLIKLNSHLHGVLGFWGPPAWWQSVEPDR